MFKSSENLRLAAEMRALQRVAAPWREARTSWFDGSPDSIEARIAATDRVLTVARAGYTGEHVALEREAAAARAELVAAQHRLMTDFLDDGARRSASRPLVHPDISFSNTMQWPNDKEDNRFTLQPFRDVGPDETIEYRRQHPSVGLFNHDASEMLTNDGAHHWASHRAAGKHDADPEMPWKNQATGEDTPTEHWENLHLSPFGDVDDYEGRHRESSYRVAGFDDYINRADLEEYLGRTMPDEDLEQANVPGLADRYLQHSPHVIGERPDRYDRDEFDGPRYPGPNWKDQWLDANGPSHDEYAQMLEDHFGGRHASRRTAGDGPGGVGDPTMDDYWADRWGLDRDTGGPLGGGGGSNSPYGDEGFSGPSDGVCRHCGEPVELEHAEGDWVHPDFYKDTYEGSFPAEHPGRDHAAEPDDDDY